MFLRFEMFLKFMILDAGYWIIFRMAELYSTFGNWSWKNYKYIWRLVLNAFRMVELSFNLRELDLSE